MYISASFHPGPNVEIAAEAHSHTNELAPSAWLNVKMDYAPVISIHATKPQLEQLALAIQKAVASLSPSEDHNADYDATSELASSTI